jgi:hypothetical protein
MLQQAQTCQRHLDRRWKVAAPVGANGVVVGVAQTLEEGRVRRDEEVGGKVGEGEGCEGSEASRVGGVVQHSLQMEQALEILQRSFRQGYLRSQVQAALGLLLHMLRPRLAVQSQLYFMLSHPHRTKTSLYQAVTLTLTVTAAA